jgi:hypothetical protein
MLPGANGIILDRASTYTNGQVYVFLCDSLLQNTPSVIGCLRYIRLSRSRYLVILGILVDAVCWGVSILACISTASCSAIY